MCALATDAFMEEEFECPVLDRIDTLAYNNSNIWNYLAVLERRKRVLKNDKIF